MTDEQTGLNSWRKCATRFRGVSVHNVAPYIEEAVRSILNQRYEDFEFIIIDDGSQVPHWRGVARLRATRASRWWLRNRAVWWTSPTEVARWPWASTSPGWIGRRRRFARQDRRPVAVPR